MPNPQKIFITGSADGLGLLAAKLLVNQGHQIVLHARNAERGRQALASVPGAEAVLTADLSVMEESIQLADKANAMGRFDAVIHNAGVYDLSAEQIFAVNTLAPFILTSLITKPDRLIYLSSGMHLSGSNNIGKISVSNPKCTYSDSKLHVLMLCKILARKWPTVFANAVDPGWVPTKMGGSNAPDNLQDGVETQCWLAEGKEDATKVSGQLFHHKRIIPHNPLADDVAAQEKLVELCKIITNYEL